MKGVLYLRSNSATASSLPAMIAACSSASRSPGFSSDISTLYIVENFVYLEETAAGLAAAGQWALEDPLNRASGPAQRRVGGHPPDVLGSATWLRHVRTTIIACPGLVRRHARAGDAPAMSASQR